jgi:signal transduction histidine kinase
MKEIRTALTVVAVAAAGIAGSLLVGRIDGLEGGDLLQLVIAMLPSLAATIVAVVIARPLLARAPIGWRMVAIATIAAAISLANIVVAARLMFVSSHDAQVLGILVAYAVAAGVGAALALARSSRGGLERLMASARRLAGGDLSARVGPIDAEPELRTLAELLDDMAERLGRSIENERAVEAMRRDLFTAISHDLRTPLASVKAISEAIEHGVIEDPKEVGRYAREMGIAIDALTGMVDDLFELVNADAEQLAPESGARLGVVLESALRACEGYAHERGVAMKTDLDGSGEVSCSPRLERVLQNLLVNAVRHTDGGEVLVEARVDDSDLVIHVTDNGEGISESQLPMVFEPFWRGDSARSSPGSGLGLSLAKRIVEHLGGQIEATSRPGRGSRFTVTVPVGARASSS